MMNYQPHTPGSSWDGITRHQPATVDLSRLPTASKRAVWRYLKEQHPAYSDLLLSPLISLMRDQFDAHVHVEQTLVRAALDAYPD
jgi:hypothetical protein